MIPSEPPNPPCQGGFFNKPLKGGVIFFVFPVSIATEEEAIAEPRTKENDHPWIFYSLIDCEEQKGKTKRRKNKISGFRHTPE